MKLYRLCIGADNRTKALDLARIQDLTAQHFPEGFTLLTGRGCWLGGHENCAVVELALDASPATRQAVWTLAEALRVVCEQQAVLLQALDVDVAFVSASTAAA